jgi:hypothetical protein
MIKSIAYVDRSKKYIVKMLYVLMPLQILGIVKRSNFVRNSIRNVCVGNTILIVNSISFAIISKMNSVNVLINALDSIKNNAFVAKNSIYIVKIYFVLTIQLLKDNARSTKTVNPLNINAYVEPMNRFAMINNYV